MTKYNSVAKPNQYIYTNQPFFNALTISTACEIGTSIHMQLAHKLVWLVIQSITVHTVIMHHIKMYRHYAGNDNNLL